MNHWIIIYTWESLKNIKCQKHIIQNPKLQRSLYELKQSGRMWYNCLSEYLLKEGFENNQICPCAFIKRTESGFAIVAVYVDDLNLVGTPEELTKIANYLKNEFEMKDLSKTNFFFRLTNWIYFKWNSYSLVSLHKESPEAFLHGMSSSFELSNGC